MPGIRRQTIVETLGATLPPEEAERAFRFALRGAGLKDKLLYRPEELAVMGQVLMQRAERELG